MSSIAMRTLMVAKSSFSISNLTWISSSSMRTSNSKIHMKRARAIINSMLRLTLVGKIIISKILTSEIQPLCRTNNTCINSNSNTLLEATKLKTTWVNLSRIFLSHHMFKNLLMSTIINKSWIRVTKITVRAITNNSSSSSTYKTTLPVITSNLAAITTKTSTVMASSRRLSKQRSPAWSKGMTARSRHTT